MKRVILTILCTMMAIVSLYADNEPDFYFGGLGYNILSNSDLTCEIGKSSYGGEVVTSPTVEYGGKDFLVLGVGPNAFYMSRCTKVTVGNGLTYIDEDAFAICSNLRKVIITNSIVDLGSNSFGYNDRLEEVIIEDGEKELVFNKSMINFCPFESTSIRKLFIGRNHSKEIFEGKCSSVTDLELGDGITKFELSYFPSLRRLTIGKNLDFLPYMNTGDYLTDIKVSSVVPQNIGGFTKRTYLNATLYVPKGTKELYENAIGWSEFWNIKEYVFTDVVSVKTQKSNVIQEYSLSGTPCSHNSKGIIIQKKKDGTVSKVIK